MIVIKPPGASDFTGRHCFSPFLNQWAEENYVTGQYQPFDKGAHPLCTNALHPTDAVFGPEDISLWKKVIDLYVELRPGVVVVVKDKPYTLGMRPKSQSDVAYCMWALHDIRKITEHPGVAALILSLMKDYGQTARQALCLTYGLYVGPRQRGSCYLFNGTFDHWTRYVFSPKEYDDMLSALSKEIGRDAYDGVAPKETTGMYLPAPTGARLDEDAALFPGAVKMTRENYWDTLFGPLKDVSVPWQGYGVYYLGSVQDVAHFLYQNYAQEVSKQ